MILSCKTLTKSASIALAVVSAVCWAATGAAAFADIAPAPITMSQSPQLPLDPLRFPPNPRKPEEIEWPEYYIDPLVDQTLEDYLSGPLWGGLSLDTGYDRFEAAPTVTWDHFLSVRAWKNQSVFFNPRVSLDATRESFSLGAGYRRLLSSKSVVGVSVFHDWARPRGSHRRFIRQAGAGVSLDALPGEFSDLSFSANAYVPLNERSTIVDGGAMVVREAFQKGADATVTFQLPAFTDTLDSSITAQAHSFGEGADGRRGYEVGVSAQTRDGMLTTSVQRSSDSQAGAGYSVNATLNLAFDWSALERGKNPLSAPYKAPDTRFNREIRDSLYARNSRRVDLPTSRTESRIALAVTVARDLVAFSGGFPDLPNRLLTVQTAQSPWVNRINIITDTRGMYVGSLRLPPGTHKLRVLHRPSGATSQTITVVASE